MLTDQKTSTISIIIPVLNEAPYLEKTLSRLSGLPCVEVIVSDGGSRDGSVEIASNAGALVIKAPQGRALQMNAGAKAAQGDILLFLHGDTVLPSGFEIQVRGALAENGVVAGAFLFAVDSSDIKFRMAERFTNMRARFFQLPYGDQAIFLRTDRFWSIGGFQNISFMEDFALVRTLRRQGRIKVLDSSAVTSGRRWQRLGLFRTTCLNQLLILGYLFGVSPSRLDRLYRFYGDRKDR